MEALQDRFPEVSDDQVSDALAKSAGHGGRAARILRSAGCREKEIPLSGPEDPQTSYRRCPAALLLTDQWIDGGVQRRQQARIEKRLDEVLDPTAAPAGLPVEATPSSNFRSPVKAF